MPTARPGPGRSSSHRGRMWKLPGELSRKHLDTRTWSSRDKWLPDFDLGATDIEEVIRDE